MREFQNSEGDSFFAICAELALELQQQCTNMQCPIPVEKQVVIAISKLATPEHQWTVTNQFSVGTLTGRDIVM